MLVLGRKVGQRVSIDGDRIIVTVVEARGEHARLGFEADKDIVILREELVDPPAKRDGDEHGRPPG